MTVAKNLGLKACAFNTALISGIVLALLWSAHARSQLGDLLKIDSAVFEAVYFIPGPKNSRAEVNFFVQSGEAENALQEGLAHYIEHLVWLNLANQSSSEHLHSNAFTGYWSTRYRMSGSSASLEELLKTMAGIFTPIKIANEVAQKEKAVISRERALRFGEIPEYPFLEQHRASLYGDHGLARSIIGNDSTITNFSLDNAVALHQRTHRPGNTAVLIYGDTDAREVLELLNSIPVMAREQEFVVDTESSEFPPARLVENYEVANLYQAKLIYSKIVPLPDDLINLDYVDRIVVLNLIKQILGSTLEGGLGRKLSFDHFIAQAFELKLSYIDRQYLELEFTGLPDFGVDTKELLKEFESELASISSMPFPEDSFRTIKERSLNRLSNAQYKSEVAFGFAAEAMMALEAPASYQKLLQSSEETSIELANSLLELLGNEGRVVVKLLDPLSP
ncbi:MAG: M16 family metallopeptidase [Pseudohongiellaceae bacterium]